LEYAWEWDALSKVKNTNDAYLFSRQKKKQKGKKEAIFGIKKKKNTQPVSQRAHYYLLCFVRCPSLLALFEKQNMEKMREEVISSGGTMDPTPAARYALSLLSIFFDCFWSCFLLLIKN
jgi:hypothetical protein